MVPVLFISVNYSSVYNIFYSSLGSLGISIFFISIYYLISPLSIILARIIVILLFFIFLLTRIILSFVYDFSGRGFTSEFFAHFSWDSFVIGLDDYGWQLFLSVIAAFLFGWLLTRLLKSNHKNTFVTLTSTICFSAVLIFLSSQHIPEFRLFKAYQKYNHVEIETKDNQTIRKETVKTLKPIRLTDEIPPLKNQVMTTLPPKPKNLVLIYLESFSDVLTENPKYPGLTPNLDRLKNDYFSFQNYYSGGYVTIEGIANSQCGTLMNMDSGNNSLTSSSGRLPNLPCMGDVLKTAGYKQVFMGGADLEFAGKGAFFSEHGYEELWGKYKWEESGFPSANTWGLSDADLFNQAFKKIQNLSESAQPFNLTLLTLGTHIPGFLYEGCKPYDQTDINNAFINGIHCTDHLIGEFINKLSQSGLLENTVVQIQGDHGIFPTSEMKDLFGTNANTHRIYNATIHPKGKNIGLNNDQPSSTLNLSANILDLLEIDHNVNFILAQSDFKTSLTPPYLVSRYTDFYSQQKIMNAWGEIDDCKTDYSSHLTLPLNFCQKSLALNAIYRLGTTYSTQQQNQKVCSLGAKIKIDEATKKVLVQWGSLSITDQFIASGRTFTEAKPGFYLIELNHQDQVINQIYLDHMKPNEMTYLANILEKEENRYVLISNLPTKTIEKLGIHQLPQDFSQNKILYSQNKKHKINNLFDKPYMTGMITFIPESCDGNIQIVDYQPNPELGEVKYCSINAWGPKQTVLGNTFNEQPNGDSAFWFKTDCAPAGTKVLFNKVPLKTVERLPTITARIDTDILVQHPGNYQIEFFHPETETVFYIDDFLVLPNETYNSPPQRPATKAHSLQPPLLIAHAGGGVNNRAYMNSLEALDLNYQLGHRFFEIDFNWTSDGKLVAIHDWENTYKRLFDSTGVPTFEQFMKKNMNHEQSQLSLSKLDQWLKQHKDAYIITDIKGNNIYGLKSMITEMDAAPEQIIPQMYHPSNYQLIKSMGYNHVIFTLYATNLPYFEIIDFVKNNPLFAVTVHPAKKNFRAILEGMNGIGTFVYVHTYNTISELIHYKDMKVDGIYTDFLYQDEKGQVQTQ